MPKLKPGPKPKARALLKRHAVMVKFDDAEWSVVRQKAQRRPLAAFMRALVLAA